MAPVLPKPRNEMTEEDWKAITPENQARGGMIVFNKYKQFLLVKDSKTGKWSFPKGVVDECDKDNTFNTAVRECKEETSLELNKDYTMKSYTPMVFYETNYYYIAQLMRDINVKELKTDEEVSDVAWFDAKKVRSNWATVNAGVRQFTKMTA